MSSARPWKVATLVGAVPAVVFLAVAAYAVGRDDTASLTAM